mmetsp:Transcript_2545/g.6450  ORF Transcript_2545/g.6450 Transcript_2545/m.6450 type:complete len:445 (+) Transcript_2545:74-1408(+)
MWAPQGARAAAFGVQTAPPTLLNSNDGRTHFDRTPLMPSASTHVNGNVHPNGRSSAGSGMKYPQPMSFQPQVGGYPSFKAPSSNKAGMSFAPSLQQTPPQRSMYMMPSNGFSPAGAGQRVGAQSSRGLGANGMLVPTPSGNPGCENRDCAEEALEPQECGDDFRAPEKREELCFGYDRRPLLPLALFASTVVGAACMCAIQIPLIGKWGIVLMAICYVFWGIIYLVTLLTMVYCALCDPGQLKADNSKAYIHVKDSKDGKLGDAEDQKLPRRAHKCWMYELPMRRYDHYCRWLMNVIALLNHREFIVLLLGLTLIGGFGIIFDAIVFGGFVATSLWPLTLPVLIHFVYCIVLLSLVFPILRIHVGLVLRNELAHEWKKNLYYIVTRQKNGQVVPVTDLSDDEFNDEFENFAYDGNKNPWDEGVLSNCAAFWCTARWTSDQLGEF